MCTLIVLHRCLPGRPLVVAANRDEFLARPAEDFAVRAASSGPILCPLDLEAGGTWVGLSRRGVFAGLTNLRPLADEPAGAAATKSRGGVVMMALGADSAAAAIAMLSALPEAAYQPFQLLVADDRDAFLVAYRRRPSVVGLEPGAHVVGNVEDERIAATLDRSGPSAGPASAGGGVGFEGLEEAHPGFGQPGFGTLDGRRETIESAEPRALKLARIRARVERLVDEPGDDLFEGLARVCREHVDGEGIANPFEATCVHVPDRSGERYGTRSSLLLELSDDPGSSRLWTTDGAPCRRPFVNRSSLLKDLGVA